jgi:hypothetical protein
LFLLRRASAFSSWARSFIAARSSSVNPFVALLVDFFVPFFGLMETSHSDSGWKASPQFECGPALF